MTGAIPTASVVNGVIVSFAGAGVEAGQILQHEVISRIMIMML